MSLTARVAMSPSRFNVLVDDMKQQKEIDDVIVVDDFNGEVYHEDVSFSYSYNPQTGFLSITVGKRHSLAAFNASDNIITNYLVKYIFEIPSSESTEIPDSMKTDSELPAPAPETSPNPEGDTNVTSTEQSVENSNTEGEGQTSEEQKEENVSNVNSSPIAGIVVKPPIKQA